MLAIIKCPNKTKKEKDVYNITTRKTNPPKNNTSRYGFE